MAPSVAATGPRGHASPSHDGTGARTVGPVALRIFRVLVRGRLHGLDEATRERLLTEADRHTVARAGFTEGGTLTYDTTLSTFGFRMQVRVRTDDGPNADTDADAEAAVRAGALAEHGARAALDRLGAGVRDLRTTVSDMAAVWERTGAGPRSDR